MVRFILWKIGESLQYKRRKNMIVDLRNQEKELASLSLSEENDREETDQDWNNIEKMDIQQEIDDYMTHFIALYSTNAMEDSASSIHTEEFEAPLDDGGNVATVVKYLDQDNCCLRYRVDLYGETMNTCINYYLCDRFVLIRKQNNYYSSWVLTPGQNDILYSEIDQWILWNDKIYIFSDNSQLEEIDKEQLEVPTIRELERLTACSQSTDLESENFSTTFQSDISSEETHSKDTKFLSLLIV